MRVLSLDLEHIKGIWGNEWIYVFEQGALVLGYVTSTQIRSAPGEDKYLLVLCPDIANSLP